MGRLNEALNDKILSLLKLGPKTIPQLAAALRVDRSKIHDHLRSLRGDRVRDGRKREPKVFLVGKQGKLHILGCSPVQDKPAQPPTRPTVFRALGVTFTIPGAPRRAIFKPRAIVRRRKLGR